VIRKAEEAARRFLIEILKRNELSKKQINFTVSVTNYRIEDSGIKCLESEQELYGIQKFAERCGKISMISIGEGCLPEVFRKNIILFCTQEGSHLGKC
jgi:hypothetical protein